ncbi:Phenoloxidase 3 [Orchesella cincta]|uniref:Phenoloxidase 3 n=1 Tax=Orchesella cincta TaxID=48709 RepID=A0A1D2MXF4_ORCCI|nr:Phenoloxidase 3 [Orchesella cincta]
MAKGTPMNFVHLFEKMSEPLGFGLRGGGGGTGDAMTYFYYQDDNMMTQALNSDTMRQTVKMMRGQMTRAKEGGMNINMVPMEMPSSMPNLRLVAELCPKNVNFCYFHPKHRQAFVVLKTIFEKQRNPDEIFKMACACRDSPMINAQLFVYALCSCLVTRRDTRHIPIPNHFEIMPDNYCTSDVVRQANKMAHMPEMPSGMAGNKMPILIDQNLVGRGTDPEHRLWYFREDILVNSHHFHWHIVFPICSPRTEGQPGYRDRRGELFYYMHHAMIARYDTERLCNSLPRTKMFDFNSLMIEEGYFGKLSSENSSKQWGTRQPFTKLSNVQTVGGPDAIGIRVEELTRWRDRILESIDIGYYVKLEANGTEKRYPLKDLKGVDVLGDIVESASGLTPHPSYYGPIGFHNMGHVLIAGSHDPTGKFREDLGVMGDVSTAMRDSAFYRWHKYIDHIFDVHKRTLDPYQLNEGEFPLVWQGIEVVPQSFYVKAANTSTRNALKTFWDTKEVDLARGLDFRRSGAGVMKTNPVVGMFTHLNHAPFDYFLKIANKTGKPQTATIRIFMAPREDENGEKFMMHEQRTLFFEMDKVSKQLQVGENEIRISSSESSVTLRDENGSSFQRLEKLFSQARTQTDVAQEAQCNCGWPQHLLLPRGTPGGTDYDLFVIVTDGSKDRVPNLERKTGCNSALSFCGVLNEKYPDARPMGYPFDRNLYTREVITSISDLTDPCLVESNQVPVSTMRTTSATLKTLQS